MNTATEITIAALVCIGLVSLALWWFADHRRGIAWAVSFMRGRFPDVSHLSVFALYEWLHDAQRPAPQLVDARSVEEFALSHLANARRMDSESTAPLRSQRSIQSAPSSSTVRRAIAAQLSPVVSRLRAAVTCGTLLVASSPGRMQIFRSNATANPRSTFILTHALSPGC